MSKDLVIAGVIVLSCLAVTTVALMTPDGKSDARKGDKTMAVEDKRHEVSPPERSPEETGKPSGFDELNANRTAPIDAFNSELNQALPPRSGETAPGPNGSPAFPGPAQVPPITSPIATPAPTVDEPKTHVVAANETLGDISLKYYGTTKHWKDIGEANKVEPESLKIGQKLIIPVLAKGPEAAPSPTNVALESGQRAYTVKDGDSLYRIAQRELGDPSRVKEIQSLNKISSPEDLRPGQVIKLPTTLPKAEAPTPVSPFGPAPATNATGKKVEYTIVEGDQLADISKKFYGTTNRWRDIVQANPGIDPDRLVVGKKINIPNVADPSAPGTTPTTGPVPPMPMPMPNANAPTTTTVEYAVKTDDTLESIAEHFYGKNTEWKKIAAANPGLNPNSLRLGQKLKIPDVPNTSGAVKPPSNGPSPMPTGPTQQPMPKPMPNPAVGPRPVTPPTSTGPNASPTSPTPPPSTPAPTNPDKSGNFAPPKSPDKESTTKPDTDDVFRELFPDQK